METAGRHYRSDYLLDAVAQLKPIAAELGLTMAQMALAWVLRRPEIASAIIGASRPEQIADNVRAVGIELPVDVLERIDQAVGSVVTTVEKPSVVGMASPVIGSRFGGTRGNVGSTGPLWVETI